MGTFNFLLDITGGTIIETIPDNFVGLTYFLGCNQIHDMLNF